MGELAGVAAGEDVRVLDLTYPGAPGPACALRPGDMFVVRPGESIAADGEVLFGQSATDRSMMTGESAGTRRRRRRRQRHRRHHA